MKYGNQRTRVIFEGETYYFDSKHEAQRFRELLLLVRAKAITDLKRQVRYRLIPAQKDKHGKLLERPCDYVADFVYIDTATGEPVVEDAKGFRTQAYIIKRKLMLERYGIRIKEV